MSNAGRQQADIHAGPASGAPNPRKTLAEFFSVETVRKLLRWTVGLTYPARFLGATSVVAVVTLIQWMIDPYVGGHIYAVFLLAVSICALVFKRLTALYALLLSCAIISYVFAEPNFSFEMSAPELASLTVFIVVSLVFITVGVVFRKLADSLNEADDQKAVLLRELRHRTANYLQMAAAAIRLAARDAKHAEARDSLVAVAQRVENIGEISKILGAYAATGVPDAGEYIEKLVSSIAGSLAGPDAIAMTARADPIPIDRELAGNLGIAVNELITNAVKYAFPGGRKGAITVEFHREANGALCLSVSDNGVGCSEGSRKGTGMGLVSALAAIHGGSVEIEDNRPGCRVNMRVRPDTK